MRVSNEVLQVLSAADLNCNSLVLTSQLDRSLYMAVNKVLEAAGWKWNRKTKTHTCDGDAVDVLEQVLLTGEVTVAKNEFGYFPTPKNIVTQLIQMADIKHGMSVLEPSAGQGAIALELCRAGADVDAFEILESNILVLVPALRAAPGMNTVVQADFITEDASPLYDRVVMNPPFARQADIKHVMHAFNFLKPGGLLVSIMSAGVTFREDELTRHFRQLVQDNNGSITPLPDAAFKESGTMVRTVIAVLNR